MRTSSTPRWPRRATVAGGALLLVLLLAVAAACVVYPPEYVRRVLVWQDSDVDDQFRFARRDLRAVPGATELPQDLQPERVRAAFAALRPGEALDDWLARQGTQGFVVLQRGRVIYEAYFGGHVRDTTATSFSVAKSFASALVYAAVEDGLITSLDDPITRHLPELRERDPRFERITLRHLLAMRSGIRYREASFLHGDDAKTYYDPDLRRLALEEARIERGPDEAWLYNNYHPLLIGLVLERATGVPVARWLETRLWQPAGMAGDASWSLDSERGGFEKLESGLNARTLDFARFGQLFLDGGVATNGRRVLSEASVRAATSPEGATDLAARSPGHYYKHLWWGQRRADGRHDFTAVGNHGQFVHVSPAHGIVIARNGRRYGVPPGEWLDLFGQLADQLGGGP